MTFIVYIIYSPTLDQFYIGHTQDLQDRLFRHNNPGSKATKKAHDWTLKYTEEFSTRAEAAARELQVKNRKSRKYIETMIGSPDSYRNGQNVPQECGKAVPPWAGYSSQNRTTRYF